MTTLVHGKYVISKVTGRDSAEVITDGVVAFENGEITSVGPFENLRTQYPGADVLGSPRHLVFPGLINDHFHIGVTPIQLGTPDLPLEMWILARMKAKAVDPCLDQLYGAVQMIESGTTTVQAIHRAYNPKPGRGPDDLEVVDKAIRAYQDAGMRVSYAPALRDSNLMAAGALGGDEAFAATLPDDLARRHRTLANQHSVSVAEARDFLGAVFDKYGRGGDPRVRITLAPANAHWCSEEMLLVFKELAVEHDTGMHIHLVETKYQRAYGETAWEKTPLRYLHDIGFLGPDVVLGHGVWLTDEDIDLIAEAGATVCHNPSSNLRLQSGIAPVNRFLSKGVRVAMGTDEAGLNDDKDMIQEMRLAKHIHREPGIDITPPTAYQVFQMATVNGAYASWFGEAIGTLEAGKRADMALMPLDHIEQPYLDPDVSVVDALVHRGRSIDVDTVIVDGEPIMKDGRLTRVDKEALYKELEEHLSRPLTPGEEETRQLLTEIEPYMRRFHTEQPLLFKEPHSYYNARS